jgi:hypothetical protein
VQHNGKRETNLNALSPLGILLVTDEQSSSEAERITNQLGESPR